MSISIEHLDATRWRQCAQEFRDHSYRQLWEFGSACANRMGARSEHIAVVQAGAVLGLADVRVKRIPVLSAGIAYINGGPLVLRGDDQDSHRLSLCLEALKEEYTGKRGFVLRVMAPVGCGDSNCQRATAFSQAGFVPSNAGKPYRTFLLDIQREPEEIRRGLAQKWRNCLNQSEKRNMTVRSGTSVDLFREFCDLFSRFAERKRFEVDLTPPFYLKVHEQLPKRDRFHISLVEAGGTVVAGHVASLLGDTCVYLLGASSDEGLRCKASYLLQWRVICAARERGLKWYDLGGIDPIDNPGVYHFKSGLGGQDVTAPGPMEYPATGWKRSVIHSAEQVYRLLRRIR